MFSAIINYSATEKEEITFLWLVKSIFFLSTYSIKDIACEVTFASEGTLQSQRKNFQLFKKTSLFIYIFLQITNFTPNVKF